MTRGMLIDINPLLHGRSSEKCHFRSIGDPANSNCSHFIKMVCYHQDLQNMLTGQWAIQCDHLTLDQCYH